MNATINDLSNSQLAAIYASLQGVPPVKFATKAKGVQRVATALRDSGKTLDAAMAEAGLVDPPAEVNGADDPVTDPAPAAAEPKAKPARAADQSGIALVSILVAPAGLAQRLKLYAFGHRTKPDGSAGVDARLSIDGQPKGGFADKGEAITWARARFGTFDAAAAWARNEASKGTRLNDRVYAGWRATAICEVEFA